MSIDEGYFVEVDDFTKRHFIKSFVKKYGDKKWSVTLRALLEEAKRIDRLIGETDRADVVSGDAEKIVKVSFKVAGTDESAKTSGNRAIMFIDEAARRVRLLLIYCKNDISPPNETQKWLRIIKGQFPDLTSQDRG